MIPTATAANTNPVAQTNTDARQASPESSPAAGSPESPTQTSVTRPPPIQIGPINFLCIPPAVAASLHPEFGPGKIPCCCHPIRNAFAAEHLGTKFATAEIKIQVNRAGIKFITSSNRAPHQPNFKYLGVLFPTIESIVLTTLNSTSPGNPATKYHAIALVNPSVRFSLKLSIAARRQAAISIRYVSRPTSRAIATRAPDKSPARAAFSTAHECFSKSRSAKHE